MIIFTNSLVNILLWKPIKKNLIQDTNLSILIPARNEEANIEKCINSIDISKKQQSSDWSNPDLSKEQINYATTDVIYLHDIKNKLDEILIRRKIERNKGSKYFLNEKKNLIPMGRFCSVQEIADMTAWVASPRCSFTTGQLFDVTGGRAKH